MREAPQRQRFMTVTAMLVALLLLGALAAAGVIEFIRQNEVKGIATVQHAISELSQQKAELEKTHAELERMRKTTELIEAELPPAPGWFLAYLGQVMPNELALTQLRVLRTNELWSVHMSGTAESRTNILETLNSFSNNLAGSSFRLTVTECKLSGVDQPAAATSSRIARLTGAMPQRVQPETGAKAGNTFVLNGIMQ